MERSCENCRNSCKVGHKMSYCIINERKCWEPDYHTLERENAKLEQSLERAWIKCSEQLPEDDCIVFFTNGKFISYGYYSKNFNIEGKKIIPLPREWISEQGLVVDCKITHWQKFYPEPPKEAAQ